MSDDERYFAAVGAAFAKLEHMLGPPREIDVAALRPPPRHCGISLYDFEEVAAYMRVSRRTLQDILRKYPFYRLVGRKKLFTDQDIRHLIEALPCPSKSSADTEAQPLPPWHRPRHHCGPKHGH